MIYSIDKQINGKFSIVVLDKDKDNHFISTVVTDWISSTFNIFCNGKNVGQIGCGSTSCWIVLNQPDAYIEYIFGTVFPHIHTATGDLLTFKEIV